MILFCVNLFAFPVTPEKRVIRWPDNVFTEKEKMLVGFRKVIDFIVDDFNRDGIQDVAVMRLDKNIPFCVSVINTNDYKYVFEQLQLQSPEKYLESGGRPYFTALKGHPVYKYISFRNENGYLVIDLFDYRLKQVNTIKTSINLPLNLNKKSVVVLSFVFIGDWNRDFVPDLIFGLSAGKIAKPRAVFCYDLITGKKIFRYDIAPMLGNSSLIDLNQDGLSEILFSTNGASDGDYFGPFARDSSYLAILKNDLSNKILWRFGGESSYLRYEIYDITGDGFSDIIAYGFSVIDKEKNPSKIVLIDGKSLEIIDSYMSDVGIFDIEIVNNGPGEIPSIWLLDRREKIVILVFDRITGKFRYDKEIDAKGIYKLVQRDDINGDGIPEMFFLNRFVHSLDIVNNEARLLGRIPMSETFVDAKLEVLNTSTNKERHYFLLCYAPQGNQFYKIYLPVNKIFPETGVLLKNKSLLLLIMFFICIIALSIFTWTKRRNQFLSNVVKSEKIGFLLVDNKLRVRAYNQTFLELLQIKKNKIHKRNLDDLLADRASSLKSALNLFILGVRDYYFNEIHMNIQGQMRDVAMEFFRCHRNKKTTWIGMLFIDISEATQTERLKAWGALAQRMVHKTKTPLGTIMLSLQRLHKTYSKNMPEKIAELDTYLNPALQEVRRVRDQVNMFVKFANINNAEKVNRDLNHVINGLLENYKSHAPEGVNWKLELEETPLPVRVDEEQLTEAVINILDNAVTAVKGKGDIEISVNRETHPLHDYGNIDCASIEIIDNGVGMDRGKIEKLFTPGYTTSDHGSGMGMVIAKSIIEMHEGEIFIDSTENLGTTVYIRLPLVK